MRTNPTGNSRKRVGVALLDVPNTCVILRPDPELAKRLPAGLPSFLWVDRDIPIGDGGTQPCALSSTPLPALIF
jgi:hypothetical protein